MKYFSELTKELYDTEEQLKTAENALQDRENVRRGKENEIVSAVESLRQCKQLVEKKQELLNTLMQNYVKEYNALPHDRDGKDIAEVRREYMPMPDLHHFLECILP